MIGGADFDSFAQYIKELKSSWIPIILVYWWWSQITSKYKELIKKDRPKWKDWSNYTSKLLIRKGVNPAYKELKKKLEDTFWIENINAFDKGYILWDQITQLWEVWTVKSFLKPFSKDKINIVPFVWMNESTWCTLNINADDVVNKIVTELKDKISNIIFLTWTWWVNNKKGELISFLTAEKVKKIVDWKDEHIEVNWWMQKKLKIIQNLLENWISKVAITKLSALKEEVEWLAGSWTMIIDLNKAKLSKLSNEDLFKMIYEKYVNEWCWKKRETPEEIINLYNNYFVLEVDWTVIWWYALNDCEVNWEKWKLLECIFSFKSWWWIWTKLWEYIKEQGNIFAFSSKEEFFKKLEFNKIDKDDPKVDIFKQFVPKTESSLFVYKK